MMKLFVLIIAALVVDGHNEKLQNEGDMQSALRPQELNPEFVSDKNGPLKAILPIRHRRNADDTNNTHDTTTQVKTYSRVVAGIVLAISAVIEVVVYIAETYWLM